MASAADAIEVDPPDDDDTATAAAATSATTSSSIVVEKHALTNVAAPWFRQWLKQHRVIETVSQVRFVTSVAINLFLRRQFAQLQRGDFSIDSLDFRINTTLYSRSMTLVRSGKWRAAMEEATMFQHSTTEEALKKCVDDVMQHLDPALRNEFQTTQASIPPSVWKTANTQLADAATTHLSTHVDDMLRRFGDAKWADKYTQWSEARQKYRGDKDAQATVFALLMFEMNMELANTTKKGV